MSLIFAPGQIWRGPGLHLRQAVREITHPTLKGPDDVSSPPVQPVDSGASIPQPGFGLWQVAEAARVTETALSLGYRLIGGAAIYRNEAGIGRGIAGSGLPRDQIFVTTKVWNDRQGFATPP